MPAEKSAVPMKTMTSRLAMMPPMEEEKAHGSSSFSCQPERPEPGARLLLRQGRKNQADLFFSLGFDKKMSFSQVRL
jgi:hypothetical protein